MYSIFHSLLRHATLNSKLAQRSTILIKPGIYVSKGCVDRYNKPLIAMEMRLDCMMQQFKYTESRSINHVRTFFHIVQGVCVPRSPGYT